MFLRIKKLQTFYKALLFPTLAFLFITLTLVNTQTPTKDDSMDFSSPIYQSLSAEEKLNKLWLKISENPHTYGFFSAFQIYTLLFKDTKPSFTEDSDVFEAPRKKLIHAAGVVAKAEYIPNDSAKIKYSGVFKGCLNAIVRLSLAKEPNYSYTSPEGAVLNFTPGVALKCLRDKVPSGNFIAMFGVDGQKSWNFFRNEMSNQIAKSTSIFLKPLEMSFSRAQEETNFMGLMPLAQYDEQGNLEKEIKFPFKLIIRPTQELRERLPDEFKLKFFEQFENIKKDTTLYEVYAMDKPGEDLFRIGKIVITTPLIQSEFGDRHLYFKHNFIEFDKKLRPELTEYYENSKNFTIQQDKKLNPDI